MTTYRDGQLILAWRKHYKYAAAVRFAEFFDEEFKCYAIDERTNLVTGIPNYIWFIYSCPFDIIRAETPIAEWDQIEDTKNDGNYHAWCDVCEKEIPYKEIHGSIKWGEYHLPGLSKTAHDIKWIYNSVRENKSNYYAWCDTCNKEIEKSDVCINKAGFDYHNKINGVTHIVTWCEVPQTNKGK